MKMIRLEGMLLKKPLFILLLMSAAPFPQSRCWSASFRWKRGI